MGNPKRKRKVIALKDQDLIDRLTVRAEREDRTPTYVMRRILDKALPAKATG